VKILIAYDGSAGADVALHDLRRAGLPLEADVLILSVADVRMPAPASEPLSLRITDLERAVRMREAIRAQVLQVVEEVRMMAQQAGTRVRAYFPAWRIEIEAIADSPARGIIKKADDWQPDLIVVGSHGRSAVSRFFLGSVSQKVLNTVGQSVRIARESSALPEAPARLLLGVDGSAEAEGMVQLVANRVWRPGSMVRVVAVADLSLLGSAVGWVGAEETDTPQRIQRMVNTVAEQLQTADLNVTTSITEGDPKRILIEEARAWGAESIFLGARGLPRVERFLLGSVSASVATHAHCSVEIVQSALPQ
jgi:nucleotide-binding universal stress UspA family protein